VTADEWACVAGTQSALIVTIPAAEEAVASHRARFDKAAAWGVPAHVTVLYPFLPPSNIDTCVIGALAGAVSSVPRSHATFETTDWFGTNVLWLAPEPAGVFQALTAAVADAFPGYQPYGGEHEEVIPHLTVGHDVPEDQLREAETKVLPHLPIRTAITVVELWCGTDAPASWHQITDFPLG
jgi:2'-5' RNA ligase